MRQEILSKNAVIAGFLSMMAVAGGAARSQDGAQVQKQEGAQKEVQSSLEQLLGSLIAGTAKPVPAGAGVPVLKLNFRPSNLLTLDSFYNMQFLWTKDSKRLVTSTEDELKVWETETGKPESLRRWKFGYHWNLFTNSGMRSDGIQNIQLAPDGSGFLFTVGDNNQAFTGSFTADSLKSLGALPTISVAEWRASIDYRPSSSHIESVIENGLKNSRLTLLGDGTHFISLLNSSDNYRHEVGGGHWYLTRQALIGGELDWSGLVQPFQDTYQDGLHAMLLGVRPAEQQAIVAVLGDKKHSAMRIEQYDLSKPRLDKPVPYSSGQKLPGKPAGTRKLLEIPNGWNHHDYEDVRASDDPQVRYMVHPHYDGSMELWDLKSGKNLGMMPIAGYKDPYESSGKTYYIQRSWGAQDILVFNDHALVATVPTEAKKLPGVTQIQFFDLATRQARLTLELKDQSGPETKTKLSLSPNGRYLAIASTVPGSSGASVLLLDLVQGRLVDVLDDDEASRRQEKEVEQRRTVASAQYRNDEQVYKAAQAERQKEFSEMMRARWAAQAESAAREMESYLKFQSQLDATNRRAATSSASNDALLFNYKYKGDFTRDEKDSNGGYKTVHYYAERELVITVNPRYR